MTKLGTWKMATALFVLCSTCFAGTEYVIANDNNLHNNVLSVYRLDTTTGTLTQFATLATNGSGLGGNQQVVNYSNIEQAISSGGACIFALNPGSSDIATFSKANGYALTGNYSHPGLDSSYDGGSLALTPNGKFLYASYSATINLAAWAVNSDCSLTYLDSYVPLARGNVGAMKVSPNGLSLVVPLPATSSAAAELFAIDPYSGGLTDLGYLGNCPPHVCDIFGVDITKDSRYAILAVEYDYAGYGLLPFAVAARITPQGLTQPRSWNLTERGGFGEAICPFLSAAAYAGSGNLYFGMSNAVVTTTFTESPLKIELINTTPVPPLRTSNGTIAATGNIMLVAEYPSQIGVYAINADGSVTELSTTTIGGMDLGMISLSVFPNTR